MIDDDDGDDDDDDDGGDHHDDEDDDEDSGDEGEAARHSVFDYMSRLDHAARTSYIPQLLSAYFTTYRGKWPGANPHSCIPWPGAGCASLSVGADG